ncbi:hypothetical protein ASJ33_00935 [Dehalococcoides mccartyi]|jgi:hypothetical protein|uniref:Uncharacterized protein n=2 Tax=Dehalococcoides mccartyi TaxID=61435 RepID=A0A0V8M4F2_9CHLR|nr:hypothetical protein [Dehalococcoides mccartyi]AII58654.1 hypothetical protein X792_00595 [Dehalococcoides mccartyi CG1]APH11813.1 hypothetical protein ASJ33_00935 [Dehalococcoides mccartyi]KSV18505.1 hypothetical protein DA01_03475 [Dehalococcoides mccartyi]
MRDLEIFRPSNRCYVLVNYMDRRLLEKGLVTDVTDKGVHFEYRLNGKHHVYHEHAEEYRVPQLWNRPLFAHVFGSAVDYDVVTGQAMFDGNMFDQAVNGKITSDALKEIKGLNKKMSINFMTILLVVAIFVGGLFVLQNKDKIFNLGSNEPATEQTIPDNPVYPDNPADNPSDGTEIPEGDYIPTNPPAGGS